MEETKSLTQSQHPEEGVAICPSESTPATPHYASGAVFTHPDVISLFHVMASSVTNPSS